MKYTVTFFREHGDEREPREITVEVEANDADQAQENADSIMELRGIDVMDYPDSDIALKEQE